METAAAKSLDRDAADVVPTLRKALETLPGQIQLESTRSLAAPRVRALQAFLSALDYESSAGLY